MIFHRGGWAQDTRYWPNSMGKRRPRRFSKGNGKSPGMGACDRVRSWGTSNPTRAWQVWWRAQAQSRTAYAILRIWL